ncbi:DinB family protein [Silvibacterium dinghuense]|uniref:DinB family protein n=1 Tax=Silvibacterium dinghuense TaxID=1560006 RepID=UPI0013E928A9|nr:DinB family protein [Silvibacterium dinghuense]GGG99258.1 hypothetical protein GCM10011586_13450 [Silvibacterium dinghuense]
MPASIAESFRDGCAALESALRAVPEALADTPWRAGGWTRKQILGHMIDSAANNHQRFVRAAIDGDYTGPFYQQEAWVEAHGYTAMSWPVLLRWWQNYHELLIAVVERIPSERLDSPCRVGTNPPVTLAFLIEDYLAHQQHHLRQIQS